MRRNFKLNIVFLFILLIVDFGYARQENNLPIKNPKDLGYIEVPSGEKTARKRYIRNSFTLKQIYDSIKGGVKGGFNFDITGIKQLLHGGSVNTDKIYGRIYIGPYPMESSEVNYVYKRFRKKGKIKKGKGFIPVNMFFLYYLNSEEWKHDGQLVIRFDLKLSKEKNDISLGVYDVIVKFKEKDGVFYKSAGIFEGPFVNMVGSEKPSEVTISFKTSEATKAAVFLKDGKGDFGDDEKKIKHEIKITGLTPATSYKYRIKIGNEYSRYFSFKTAPKAGNGEFVFTYSGDSRAGVGIGDTNYLGVNYRTIERLANLAYQRGSEFFIFGGDFINGNSASVDDFRTQIHGWKQAMTGFWNHRPVYTCIGNHESLIKLMENDKLFGRLKTIRIDRWPYATESAEAVFKDEFTYPENAPKTEDKRRPSYSENVYSFQYGQVKIIVFNNNYWIAKGRSPRGVLPKKLGGCPEGYIMRDQMNWIKSQLDEAERNSTVKFVILFAQEPVFPNGGHIQDAMWYNGDNTVRAFYTDKTGNKLKDEGKGIIDVRNEFVRMLASNKKVAAVLGSDEHAFHKVLIDKNVPIGNMDTDDINKNGKIDKNEPISPLKDLKYPVWYMVSGGGGAPYYAVGNAPWKRYWYGKYGNDKKKLKERFYYSSQENIIMFKVKNGKISAKIINPYGDTIDEIDDLMKIKENN